MTEIISFVAFVVLMVGGMLIARDAGLQAEQKKTKKNTNNITSEVYAEFITNVMIDAMVPGKKR